LTVVMAILLLTGLFPGFTVRGLERVTEAQGTASLAAERETGAATTDPKGFPGPKAHVSSTTGFELLP
ncbi:MAG TPA: hypothetical protein VLS88_02735, partial [Polyangiales bacterium]|nr:hypothetical protein [Polyangiales bacterium]